MDVPAKPRTVIGLRSWVDGVQRGHTWAELEIRPVEDELARIGQAVLSLTQAPVIALTCDG